MALQNLSLIMMVITIFTMPSFSLISEANLGSTNEMVFKEFFQNSSSKVGGFKGTKWAVLVAGSKDYWNYRHQADICHAYQIMKRNGVKDKNIIVFMYDDIAYNKENPRQGVIVNHPHGHNVYPGVPKDYTGKEVNSKNLYAVLLGKKEGVRGGSGKVLKSGPNDHIFIYYADHGGPGVLGMPNHKDMIYANDLMRVLKKKHASKAYEKMVIYVEACESGSIFEGVLPENLNIYATTAANKHESSYGTYCSDKEYIPLSNKFDYGTCLGDLFSVSWMEDSDAHDPRKETFQQQYTRVKKRTGHDIKFGSHVMQYGNKSLCKDHLAEYWVGNVSTPSYNYITTQISHESFAPLMTVDQRDADLLYFHHKVHRAPKGSDKRSEAQNKLSEVIYQRKQMDQIVEDIVKALFGEAQVQPLLNGSSPFGKPLVEDWDCLKSMVKTYEKYCGSLNTYGMKYMRAFANMCNNGVREHQMARASQQVCASDQ